MGDPLTTCPQMRPSVPSMAMVLAVLDNEGVQDFGQTLVKLDVNDSTDDGDHLALGAGGGGRGSNILDCLFSERIT